MGQDGYSGRFGHRGASTNPCDVLGRGVGSVPFHRVATIVLGPGSEIPKITALAYTYTLRNFAPYNPRQVRTQRSHLPPLPEAWKRQGDRARVRKEKADGRKRRKKAEAEALRKPVPEPNPRSKLRLLL